MRLLTCVAFISFAVASTALAQAPAAEPGQFDYFLFPLTVGLRF